MDNLTFEEASKLVGRSRATLWRWKRDAGVDITNRQELLNFSDHQDYRFRGAARQNCRRRRLAALDRESATSEIQALFRGVSPDEYVDLPAPFSQETANRLMRLLREIEAGFSERLEQLQSVGAGEVNIGIATSEREEIRKAYQILDDIFAEYPD